MGFDMHAAFERREEWKAARLSEIEFAEMARALKAVATERGVAAEPVIDELSHHGLTAALLALSEGAGATVDAQYWRCRARAQGE